MLTDAQVEAIRAWNQKVQALRARRAAVMSRKQLRVELGLSDTTLARTISRGADYHEPATGKRSKGRRPSVSHETALRVLTWHAQMLALGQELRDLRTQGQFARELGCSHTVISRLTRNGFQYKQVAPEKREEERARRHRRIAELERRGLM
ncbi:MAG: hypothetical protein ABI885_28245 [Gammaproteobacteria bacterium]